MTARHSTLFCIFAFGLLPLHAGQVVIWGSAQAPAPSIGEVRQVSSGLGHTLALRTDGTVAVWGRNFNGQTNVPPGLDSVRQVAAGEFFSLAVRSNGTVIAWGDNLYGQREVPAGLGNVVAASGGHGHVLALKTDGSVVAWGANAYGQTNVPTGLGTVTAVRAIGNYSMALKANGTVAVWGENSFGQTNVPAGLSDVKAIDGNLNYCLAVRSNGTVVSWGFGPALPQGLTDVMAVAAGENHALALKSDGSVVAWGSNDGGQLQIPASLLSAGAIEASWHHSAAVSASASPVFFGFEPSWAGGVFSLQVATQPGFTYRLEYKNSLSDPTWTSLSAVPGTGGVVTLTDNSANASQRCYRIAREGSL